MSRRSRRLCTIIVAAALTLVAAPAAAASASGGTTYVWVGASQDPGADNHSWNDPRNWSPSGVPGDGDSAVVTPPDAAHCAAAVDGVPPVSLVQLTLAVPPTVCGASLTGGPITVTGSFTWDGGNLAAPLILAAGSTSVVSAANEHQNTVSAPITVQGSLSLSGLSGNGLLFFSNYVPLAITVTAGGTLHSTGATEIRALSCCSSPASIVNNGTLQIDSGRMHASAIEIDQNDTLSVGRNAILDSDGGVVTAASGATYAGAGTWTIENQADARLLGGQTLGTQFHLQLGTVGAVAGATLGGRFTLRGSGTFDWSAGSLGGSITVAATAHVHVSGVTVNNGRRIFVATDPASGSTRPSKLTNHGTVKLDNGASVTQSSGTTVTNASDGVLTLAAGTAINGSGCCLNTALLANDGGRVNIGTGAAAVPVALPMVSFQDDAGTVSIPSGQSVQLTHGPKHSLTATRLVGGGTLQVAGAMTVSGDVALADGSAIALASGGSLDGTGTIDGDGAVQWTGGSMSGDLTLAPQGGTAVSGTAVKYLTPAPGGAPSTVHVQTALTFAPGTSAAHDYLDLGASALVLHGRTTVPAFVEIHAGSLTNTGKLTVDAGADHADRTGPTETTVNTGTLAVASGTLALAHVYQQPRGKLVITTSSTGTGRVTVVHGASVAGTVHMINHTVPADGATLTVLTSNALTWSGSVTTTGQGADAGHWVAAPTATMLAVQWQAD